MYYSEQCTGKYSDSRQKYEMCLKLLDSLDSDSLLRANLKECCLAGLIRTSLQLGDIPRGMGLLSQSTDVRLIETCSYILEGLKQYSEAAKLQETVGKWDNAANLWIKGEYAFCAFWSPAYNNFSQKLGKRGQNHKQGQQYPRLLAVRKG